MDTYLNIGSIENFREYYTTYAEVAIGEYEHWEEEEWVDAANPDWQKFIGQLSQELNEKGVDGFFINNCDVYDYAPHESIFEGLTAILQNMMTFGKAVIINVVEFLAFAAIGVVGLLLTLGITKLSEISLGSVTSGYQMIGKIVSTMIAFLWNFFARKYLLFSKKES